MGLLSFIPCTGRNRHLNRCVNVWSVAVMATFILAVAGGYFMYGSFNKVFADVSDDIKHHLSESALGELVDDAGIEGELSMVKAQDAYKMGIAAMVLVGPILSIIGMIFFCCQLKKISVTEGACAACCGGVFGCAIFPVIMTIASAISIAAACVMGLAAGYIYDPLAVLSWTDMLDDGNYDNDMDAWKGLARIAYRGSMAAVQGHLCETDYYTQDDYNWNTWSDATYYNEWDTADAHWYNPAASTMWGADHWATPAVYATHDSYQDREVMRKDCENFANAYRFGLASMCLASICGLWGLIITFWIGCKSCRGSDKDDVELDDIENQ